MGSKGNTEKKRKPIKDNWIEWIEFKVNKRRDVVQITTRITSVRSRDNIKLKNLKVN